MKNIISKASIEIIAPASIVWEALISPDIIKKYYFNAFALSDWKVGEVIEFRITVEDNIYSEKGTILEMNPFKTFRFNYWSELSGLDDKPENYIPITYSLVESKGITTLTVTEENIFNEAMKLKTDRNWGKILQTLKDVVENEMVSMVSK